MNLMFRHGGSTSLENPKVAWQKSGATLQVVGQAARLLAPEWYPIGGRAFLGLDTGPRLARRPRAGWSRRGTTYPWLAW